MTFSRSQTEPQNLATVRLVVCSLIWSHLAILFGEGSGTPLQYSCLENPMDGGAWWAAGQGVAGSWTWLSDFTFPFHFHALEKEVATHSSVLAWRIPGTGEPGGLPSMGSHRVGHDWSDLAAAHSWDGNAQRTIRWQQGHTYLFVCFGRRACRILVPRPGIKSTPPALEP